MPVTLNQLLDKLDAARRLYGSVKSSELVGTLTRLASAKIADADELVRLHEALLFLAAYPQSKTVLGKVERLLKSVRQRVATLETQDADLSPLDAPEVSGIAGRSVTSNFSHALARWLARKYPRQLSIDWDWMENEEQWAAILPRFLPLLADDAMVEAHVPLREWMQAATGRQNEIVWLIDRFESLDLTEKEKAELYDSLKLHITWKFPFSASRTGMRLPPRNTFFHSRAR